MLKQVLIFTAVVTMLMVNPAIGAVTELPATVNAEVLCNPRFLDRCGKVMEVPATVNAGVQVKPKVYYLTENSFDGGDAITACDSGFHMASISEIQDPSSLQYATRSTPAYDAPAYDPGIGPSSDHMGWVRTGSFSLAGVPDYSDFRMSSFDQQSGTTMSRRTLWDYPSRELLESTATSWWYITQEPRSQPESVWCVEDPD